MIEGYSEDIQDECNWMFAHFPEETLHLYNAVDVSRTFPEWPLFEKLTFLRTPDRE